MCWGRTHIQFAAMPNFSRVTNAVWASALLTACYRNGMRHLCIAPGSRSAVLAVAAAHLRERCADLTLHTHFDERGLAFFALGLARATNSPVAVITTSGTAVANLHPAVVEAFESSIPLWVVSADRPDHLLGCGANQAIHQKQLLGSHVLFNVNYGLPETTAALNKQIDALALGMQCLGPIHVNCQFDEPLYDAVSLYDTVPEGDTLARTTCAVVPVTTESTWIKHLCEHASTLVVLGALTPAQARTLEPWLQQLTCPIIADVTSQFRFSLLPTLLSYADLLLSSPRFSENLVVEQVLQLGGRIVSKRINRWLTLHAGTYVLLSEQHASLDPTHQALQVRVDFDALETPPSWSFPTVDALLRADKKLSEAQMELLRTQWSEAAVCKQLSAHLPAKNTALFAGNSLSIRMLDSYGIPSRASVDVYGNRGASGIDGLIASAAGLVWGNVERVILVIGDTAFLHDLNSLALFKRLPKPIKVLLLNNNGGQIFGMLPALDTSVYEELFAMPHHYNFQHACRQFDIDYVSVNSRSQFDQQLVAWLSDGTTSVMECCFTDSLAVLRNNLTTLEKCL